MEFAVWVFRNAQPQRLAPAASSILDGCLTLLDDSAPRGALLLPRGRRQALAV